MWNLFLCLLDLIACIIISLSCILLLVWTKFVEIYSVMSSLVILLVLFYGLDYYSYGLGSKERKRFHVDALVATHVCFVMVFVSHVDMTFSWMISTPVVR
jgi:hypothetical protein